MAVTKELAEYLRGHGRNGDTELVHMSRQELDAMRQGLGALSGRDITRNPHTGLPEMFNWTSLIPAVVGIGGTILSGGTMSPLMAGLISGAATTAATGGDWKRGIMSGLGGAAFGGLGEGLGEMGMVGGDAAAGAAGAAGEGALAGAAPGAAGAGMAAGETGAMDAGIGSLGGMQGAGAAGDAAGMGTAGTDIAESGGTMMQAPGAAQISAQDAAESGGTMFQGAPQSQALGQSAMPQMGSAANAAPAVDPYEVDGAQAAGPGADAAAAGKRDATLEEAFGGKNLQKRTIPGILATYAMMQGVSAPNGQPGLPQQQPAAPHRRLHYVHDQNPVDQRDASWTATGGAPRYFQPGRYEDAGTFAEGGMVQRYAEGGAVEDDLVPITVDGGIQMFVPRSSTMPMYPGMPTPAPAAAAPGTAGGAPAAPPPPPLTHPTQQTIRKIDPQSLIGSGDIAGTRAMAAGGMVGMADQGIASLPQGDASLGDTKRVRAIRSHYRSKKDLVADLQRGSSLPGQLGVNDPSDPILDVAFGYTARQGRHNKSLTPQFQEGGIIGGTKPAGMSEGEWKRLYYTAYGDNDDMNKMYLSAEERDGPRLGKEVMRTPSHEVHNPQNANHAADALNSRPRVQMAGGGFVHHAMGDGMSDSVPASIDGRQPARIASNEYVVPADAVAHAGNGSSEAGARELDAMVARLRQARTGTAQQAPRINPRKVMPR